MAKIFNKVKTTAGLEAQYQTKKSKDDFRHEGEIATNVSVLKTIRAAAQLRHTFHVYLDKTKDANNSENNCGTSFNAAGGEHNVEHWTQLGSALVDVTVKRMQLLDAIAKVHEEWKVFESSDIKKVLELEEKCNRALSDKEYYAKHDQSALSNQDGVYRESGQKLIAGVQELNVNAMKMFQGWSKRIAEAEAMFYVAAGAVWQKAVNGIQ